MNCVNYAAILLIFCGVIRCESAAHEAVLSGARTDTNNLDKTSMNRYETWILSLIASCIIGMSGIAPLIFIPSEVSLGFGKEGGGKCLRLLLSFAVGGLLGDVFLHLLPEAWSSQKRMNAPHVSNHIILGLWVLLGMFSFIIIEMMFTASKTDCVPENTCQIKSICKEKCSNELVTSSSRDHFSTSTITQRSTVYCGDRNAVPNGHLKLKPEPDKCSSSSEMVEDSRPVQVAGYLNLMANSIDNFTHGLAVAASFLVGCKMGVLTTFAILIHEIPHEIGDFAILLKSGFHPWTAAKAQMSTSTIGILGVIVALSAESVDQVGVCTLWILPFTAGGFLNIALVNVLPDLLKEKDPWESIKQLVCICAGIGVMAVVSLLV